MKKATLIRGAMAAALIFCSTGAAMADAEHAGAMKKVGTGKVLAWLNNPAVIDAVKAQNAKHASIDQAKIDALDKTWRAEVKSGGGPLSSATLANPLSGYLKTVKANGKGLYTEIFVMDNKGLNVGQSDMTSDYWQGDEAKWKKTYLVGKDAMDIGEIKTDKSTQALQSQLSMAITDPASGKVIGAVTVGVNVEMLD
tara:strand:- start:716 stop:1306 length:591 start_codon:yes stop_codon:yes gene_type:complete